MKVAAEAAAILAADPDGRGFTEGSAAKDRRWLWRCVALLLASLVFNVFFLVRWASADPQLTACCRDCPQVHTGAAVAAPLVQQHVDGLDDPVALLPGTSDPHQRRLDEVSTTTDASHSSSHSEAETHQHDALIFLFNALLIGAAVMHFNTYFHFLQQTVMLFMLGMIVSWIVEGLKVKGRIGVFGDSYDMWMEIDPHLLLFTLLPALLAGDAMTIDTSVARRVAYQCLYLAGPGVLVNALLIAGFLRLYLDWDFWLSLTTGAILTATDPVSVVALLKELGASPVLTVQIQGESLLNDGTSIVMFLIAYDIVSGKEYDFADVTMFLVRTALMAWAIGMFIGFFFFSWIRLAANKFDHNSAMLQIVITICCAYWSYIMAEGVFHMSGILATVASSLILSHYMWPHIVSTQSMHHVWQAFESLGNIIVFFLAGALCGKAMIKIEAIYYLRLLVLYAFVMVSRGVVIFASRPFLRCLSPEKQAVSLSDALVMTWGGLRGAVGLALAIQVSADGAPNEAGEKQIADDKAELVLFFVSGIAFLTTLVNATTAPKLVEWLGIAGMPRAQTQLLKMLHNQLVKTSVDHNNPAPVTESLAYMLHKIEDHLDPRAKKQEQGNQHVNRSTSAFATATVSASIQATAHLRAVFRSGPSTVHSPSEICDSFRQHLAKFKDLPEQDLKLLGELPKGNILGKIDHLLTIVEDAPPNRSMAKVINKAFLSLVMQSYWKQIEAGDLQPGSAEAEVLFTSIRVALSPLKADLMDFDFVYEHTRDYLRAESADWWKVFPDDEGGDESPTKVAPEEEEPTLAHSRSKELANETLLMRTVSSTAFNFFIATTIVLNAAYVAVEDGVRDSSNEDSPWWLIAEVVFSAIFTGEFLLKLAALHCRYFHSASNVFDFVLVLLGIFGVTMSLIESSKSSLWSEARLIRMAKVFRVLRFLRIFRLFHAKLSVDKYVSHDVAKHMHRITVLVCFTNAHLVSQVALLNYFGGSVDGGSNGQQEVPMNNELARCIVQSQISCIRALCLAVAEERKMDRGLMEELRWVRKRKDITEALERFVMGAYKDGAITAREAESILKPLREQIAKCMQEIQNTKDGILVARSVGRRASEASVRSTSGSQGMGYMRQPTLAEPPNPKDLEILQAFATEPPIYPADD